jgi:hypothetical protein
MSSLISLLVWDFVDHFADASKMVLCHSIFTLANPQLGLGVGTNSSWG